MAGTTPLPYLRPNRLEGTSGFEQPELPGERPDIEVFVDTVWHKAELRMWSRRDDGTWWVNVNGSRDGMRHVGRFPAGRVRINKSEWRPDW